MQRHKSSRNVLTSMNILIYRLVSLLGVQPLVVLIQRKPQSSFNECFYLVVLSGQKSDIVISLGASKFLVTQVSVSTQHYSACRIKFNEHCHLLFWTMMMQGVYSVSRRTIDFQRKTMEPEQQIQNRMSKSKTLEQKFLSQA